MRRRAILAAMLLAATAGGGSPAPPAPAAAPPALGSGRAASDPANPCLGEGGAALLCPDFQMLPPFNLRLDRRARPGRTLLRAANSLDSAGEGPVEMRGHRDGRTTMSVRQRIRRRDGSRLSVPTRGRLTFYPIPRHGRFWKFRDAARFELWSVGPTGERGTLVRTGPKVHYCLRDLRRTRPGRTSPRRAVYPACNKRRGTRAVTLGTSVGWSDVYGAGYHEQWIDVTGLRGRFLFIHVADPENGVWESDEGNNEGSRTIQLPLRARRPPRPAEDDPY